LLNLFLLYVMVDLFILNKYVAGAAGIAFTTVISFIGHNLFSFRNEKRGE